MPSPNIVRDIRTLIQNNLAPSLPSRWGCQLTFGLQAYGLHTFQSIAGNARMAATTCRTASAVRKSERLLANAQLANNLGVAFDSLGLVKRGSYVNVDHSDVNRLTALVGAVQTRNGRAIPCFVETTYANQISARADAAPRIRHLRKAMLTARQVQSFTGHTIDALQTFHDRLGFWPKLVFDRGFGNESIVTHLHAEGATFYVRLKAGRYVELDGEKHQIKELREKDTAIQLYGLTLRVVRSPKSHRSPEPWYILTNDQQRSRTSIVRIYYHRFEIEETFKDMKHIFELKRTRLNKPLSLKLLFWFVALGIAILFVVTKPTKQDIRTTPNGKRIHPKKQTSWLRQAYEQLQQGFALLAWGEG